MMYINNYCPKQLTKCLEFSVNFREFLFFISYGSELKELTTEEIKRNYFSHSNWGWNWPKPI